MAEISTSSRLRSHYEAYLKQVNNVKTHNLDVYLASTILHNDRSLSQAQYHQLIHPGSVFTLLHLTVDIDQIQVGARLRIELKGGTVLSEFVFYQFDGEGRIERVWSMVQDMTTGEKY